MLVASDHASARLAGEQAALLSWVSYEWCESKGERLQYVLKAREGSGLDSDRELEPDIKELGEMLEGMEAVEQRVARQFRERFGD